MHERCLSGAEERKAAWRCFHFRDNHWISKATHISDLSLLAGRKGVPELSVHGQGCPFRLWAVSSDFLAETLLQNSSIFTKMINCSMSAPSCAMEGELWYRERQPHSSPQAPYTPVLMQYELVWWAESSCSWPLSLDFWERFAQSASSFLYQPCKTDTKVAHCSQSGTGDRDTVEWKADFIKAEAW